VITEETEPALCGIWVTRSTPHPAGNAALGDLETEHDKFAVNAWSAPGRVLGHRPEDQFADLFGHWPSADRLAYPGNEPPVESKAGTVPTHDRIGRNHNQGLFPGRPEATQNNPEELVPRLEPGTGVVSLEHRQLLPQSEILN